MDEVTEWGANFDGCDVEPFLLHVASRIESGFGPAEARATAKRIRRLWLESRAKFSFEIRLDGATTQLRIRAFMDDIDAPDLSFVAPKALCEMMASERKRIEAERAAGEAPRGRGGPPLGVRIRAAAWSLLARLLTRFEGGRRR